MSKEDEIKKEVLDLYSSYALKLGRDTSTITADTILAFPAGLKLTVIQRKSLKPDLNKILNRENAKLFVNDDVTSFIKIKDAQSKVWDRIKSRE
ncbi:hypothetical protein [Rheinheimera sp.]|uniref:hypothetical protein n=1 Tax=Rheinheimera sp. TaxID=1869214 RepID=UPI0027339520|nr:hypothetical protein [Rheinheimera sp.]MDP2716435.1 hypothetical protein [Rheinheimera sp.]